MPAIRQQSPSHEPLSSTLPIHEPPAFPLPKLRLQLHDLGHDGSAIFLSNVKASEDVSHQVQTVLRLLYRSPSSSTSNPGTTSPRPTPPPQQQQRPPTRSVTLILRDLGEGAVAYTTGTELDPEQHKEIHVHLGYLARARAQVREEILGVLCHELVHCFQWNAGGAAPSGLIEGVADWVRLRAGLAAAHWRQEADGRWDAGYQHTAFFLDYLERRFGDGTVRGINEGLREAGYDEEKVFGDVCAGRKVEKLWEEYGEDLRRRRAAAVSPNGRLMRDDD